FTPAINPPWETKSDWDTFRELAEAVSDMAPGHIEKVTDLVAVPLLHDTADAMSVPNGRVQDWKAGEVELIPGKTAPKFVLVERDYTALGAQWSALGPLMEKLGTATKGVPVDVTPEVERLAKV